MPLPKKCWYLRTVHKCFMEQCVVLATFVSLYGTAPLYLLTAEVAFLRMHVHDAFFPLYKVRGSPKRCGGGGGVLTPMTPSPWIRPCHLLRTLLCDVCLIWWYKVTYNCSLDTDGLVLWVLKEPVLVGGADVGGARQVDGEEAMEALFSLQYLVVSCPTLNTTA